MGLVLDDVLRNPVFERTRPALLVGEDQVRRPIRWVHSTDVFEVASLLRGGELLLTTGLGLAGADAHRRRHYVRGLAEVGLGALALELGWTLSEVPPDMIDEAARHELPLIALRQVVPFVEITEAVNGAIVDSSIVGLRFADRLSHALSDALAHGADVDQLLELLSQLVKAPAMLVGPDGVPIGWTGPQTSAAELLAAGGSSATVSVDGVPFASLLVGDPGARSAEVVREALDRACPAFALRLLSSRAEVATRLHASRQLLRRLAAGDRSPALGTLARAVGLPTERATYLVVVVDALLPRAPTVLREAATRMGARHAVTTLDGQALALIAAPDESGGAPLDDSVAEALAGQLPKTDQPRAAVGTVVENLTDATASLRHARAAFQVGSVVTGTGPVAVATRLTAERLLLQLPATELAQLVSEHLGGMVALPSPRRDQLLSTLETYLASGRSKSATARQLRLRRQSLYQRLRRIRTLLGRDIDEPAISTGLSLAIRAWRIQQSVPVTR
jgi:PucR family transcriptional regulator, purine catabolism regulatory protein